jgi:hypothetical protein
VTAPRPARDGAPLYEISAYGGDTDASRFRVNRTGAPVNPRARRTPTQSCAPPRRRPNLVVWPSTTDHRTRTIGAVSIARAGIEDADASDPYECWCCGAVHAPNQMVHLGNHPEVAICIRCAYSIKNWAWQIEDGNKTGPGVKARDLFRRARKNVMRRQLHQNKWIGRPLRWLGRRLP